MLDIATQVPNLKKVAFRRNVSEVVSGSGFTRGGECPMDGVYTAEGKLFIGTYPGSRWFDEDVDWSCQTPEDLAEAVPSDPFHLSKIWQIK